MMVRHHTKRGEAYRRAIEELKALQASKNITPAHHRLKRQRVEAYHRAMRRICKEYRISMFTVYRDMRKRVPGMRKVRYDRGTIRKRNHPTLIRKVDELMKARKTQKEISAKLGVSAQRIRRARARIADDAGTQPERTMFGAEAKKFIEKLFQLDLIAPGRGIVLHHKGVRVVIGREDLKDIILIVANAYNRQCYAEQKKLKVDRAQLRNAMMHHLVEEQMMVARENSDYKLVEALTRMLDRLREETALPDDFDTVLKVCQELKADVSREDVIALIKKVASE